MPAGSLRLVVTTPAGSLVREGDPEVEASVRDKWSFARTHLPGHSKRAASRRFAAGGRHGVASLEDFEPRRNARRSRADDQAASQPGAGHPHDRRGHGRRSFPRGHEPHASIVNPGLLVREGSLDKASGIGRTESGPDNRQEIESKSGESRRQWVCLGSDQAESPVTTSNFFRRVLTT